MKSLEVAMLPELVETPLEGRVAVVIDVLRATTTVTWALAHGAAKIYACETIEEARERAGSSPMLLGGERKGEQIEGFDLGNSPLDYKADTVGGRTIAFTTTNGTRSMVWCRDASEVLLASFSNFSSVLNRLDQTTETTIVCSGTARQVTSEDVLLAGALTEQLLARHPTLECNDQSRVSLQAWRGAMQSMSLVEALMDSKGGRNLQRLGRMEDIELAARRDALDIVGRFDPATREIQLA